MTDYVNGRKVEWPELATGDSRSLSKSWVNMVLSLSDDEAGKVLKAALGEEKTDGLSGRGMMVLDILNREIDLQDPVKRSYRKAQIKKELER